MKNYYLLILIVVTGACSLPNFRSNDNISNATGSQKSDPAGGMLTASSDPKADLKKMSDKFMAVNSFRAKMDGTGKTPMSMEIDHIAPDRFHTKTSMGTETIVVGKETYMKRNGSWTKMGIDLSKTIPNLREMFTEEGLKLVIDIKYTGDESVDGQPALIYTYTGKSPADQSIHNSKIWISKNTGLPLKIDVTYPTGPLEKAVIVYDYESAIVIEAPIKP